MTRTAILILSLLLLGSTPLTGGQGQDQQDGEPEWWDEDWHIRVPVTVHNDLGTTVENHVARTELALSDLLAEQGWPGSPAGGSQRLQAFVLNEASLRVVEYTNLASPTSGVGNGRVLEEVPARLWRGWFETQEPAPFNNATNPILTVSWLMPGAMEPDEERTFYLYLDTQANGDKPSAPDLPPGPFLENEYYVGRGMRLFGYAQQLWVVGLHDDTGVEVHRYASPSKTVPVVPPESTDQTNPFVVQRAQERVYKLGSSAPIPVMVEADKPVLVTAGGRGVLPSHEGLLAGHTFTAPVAERGLYADRDAPSKTYAMTTAGVRSEVEVNGGRVSLDPGTPVETLIEGRASIQVARGDPVIIHDLPPGGLIQVPSVDGAPYGQELRGMPWTFLVHAPGADGEEVPPHDHLRPGRFAAIAPDLPASARFSLIERDEQIFPRDPDLFTQVIQPGAINGVGNGGSIERFPVNPHPEAPPSSVAFRVDPRETPDATLFAWVGSQENDEFTMGSINQDAAGTTGSARVVSPYAGIDALQFEGVARADGLGDLITVFAFYDNTEVLLTNPDQPTPSRTTLARDEHRTLPTHGAWSMTASKPVAVLPSFITGFFPSALESPHVEVGNAAFHGPLVSIAPALDEPEPLLHTVAPGEQTTYTLNVTNLGRSVDGRGLKDQINLRVNDAPAGWQFELSEETLNLQGGTSETVEMHVSASEDAAVGERTTFSIDAISDTNPAVRDTVRAITFVKVHHEVGMWFERAQGPTTRNLVLDPSQTIQAPIAIQNLGTATDTIDLTLTGGNIEGWSSSLLDADGAPIRTVTLEPDEIKVLLLEALAPSSERSTLVPFEIVAQSEGNSAAVAKVLGTLKIRTITDLRVSLDNETRFVEPGKLATFNVTLDNQGNDAINVLLTVSGPPRQGWSAPDATLQGASIRELSNLPPGNPLTLHLAVPVPDEALAFERASVRFRAEAVEKDGSALGGGEEALATVVVEPVRNVQIRHPEGGYRLSPSDTVSLNLTVENRGNADEILLLEPKSWPSGWSIGNVPLVDARANTTQDALLELTPPSHTPPGNYSIELDLRSAGTVRNTTSLELIVPEAPLVSVTLAEGDTVLPMGREEHVTLLVENVGNVLRDLDLNLSLNEEALPLLHQRLTLSPGDRLQIPAHLDLSNLTDPGPTNLTVTLNGTGQDNWPTERQQLAIETVTPNLVLQQAVAPRELAALGGEDLFTVRSVIVNEGPIPIKDVDVALFVDGEVVDTVRVEHLPVGTPRVATLSWRVDGHPSEAHIVVNPHAAIIEQTREDNTISLESSDEGALIPGVLLPTLLAILTVAARLTSRGVTRGRLCEGGSSLKQPPEVPPEELSKPPG